MPSSGTTALSTSGDTAVIAIAADALTSPPYHNVVIVNTGAAAGFWSIDSGQTWNYLTAQVNSVPGGVFLNNIELDGAHSIKIKRIASGNNLSGIFVTVV